jgi:hypothetical protein
MINAAGISPPRSPLPERPSRKEGVPESTPEAEGLVEAHPSNRDSFLDEIAQERLLGVELPKNASVIVLLRPGQAVPERLAQAPKIKIEEEELAGAFADLIRTKNPKVADIIESNPGSILLSGIDATIDGIDPGRRRPYGTRMGGLRQSDRERRTKPRSPHSSPRNDQTKGSRHHSTAHGQPIDRRNDRRRLPSGRRRLRSSPPKKRNSK